jgi:undecaprenyl-diphosphatase
MDILHALILGIVQGITEFLPISSSAHLILTSKLLGWADQGINFDMAVHFGSLIAVIIYFRKQVFCIIQGNLDFITNKNTKNASLFKKIVIATIPILVLGFFLKDLVETTFRDNIAIIGVTSIFWGILLYFADKKEQTITSSDNITYKTAFFMGIAQAIAIIPGTSRSGSTITIARFLKFSRTVSAEFSMLMSIPVISLMMLLNIYEIYQKSEIASIDYQFLIVGTISSFIFAILTIHLLMKLVNKIGFLPFVIYRIILGIVIFYII